MNRRASSINKSGFVLSWPEHSSGIRAIFLNATLICPGASSGFIVWMEESMELGFKIDAFFSRYGRQPGVTSWDRAGFSRELRYWAKKGLTVVELTADLHST